MFHFKKGAAGLMAGISAFSCVVPAFASNIWDESYTHNQKEGSDSNVDVNVLVQNRTVPMIFSAYVPATVKIAVSRDKQIITPENLRIINGVDTLPIGVWDVFANPTNNWTILDWDTNFKDKQLTDQKKFAMTLNGNDLSAPVSKLPWEIQAGGELPLELDAKITYQSQAKDLEEIMTVSFTMDWMDRIDPPQIRPHATGSPIDNYNLYHKLGHLTGNISFSRSKAPARATIPLTDDKSVVAEIIGQNAIVYSKDGGGVFAPVDSTGLFSGYNRHGMLNAQSIDVSGLDTSKTVDLYAIFFNMDRLKSITGLQNWDTSHVTDMEDVFENCEALETISGLYGWDTSNVRTMSGMFYLVPAKTLDLSSFDTRAITHSFDHIFSGCQATTVYCRTQSDLNRLKAAGGTATGFIVGRP